MDFDLLNYELPLYVKDHDTLQMPEEDTEFNRKLNKVYKRTILLFPLLTNQEVGGISAAIRCNC